MSSLYQINESVDDRIEEYWGWEQLVERDILVPVEPDYYEVETDGTSLSGPRFRAVTERPDGPMYAYSPEPLERYAVYRVRLTDGEVDG